MISSIVAGDKSEELEQEATPDDEESVVGASDEPHVGIEVSDMGSITIFQNIATTSRKELRYS